MKCELCGRGITWRRIARDGALVVRRPDMTFHEFCGGCAVRDLVELDELDFIRVLLVRAAVDYRLHPDAGELKHRQLVLSS